jgi:hypothetical protein
VIDSKSFRQFKQQQKALERRKDRRSARAQLQQAARDAQDAHAAHLVELLQRLKTLDEESPHAGMDDLLRTFDEAQRGELYQALWAAPEAARSTNSIVVACGEELLFFDPDFLERPARSVDLSGPAGGLRSVSRVSDAQGRGLLIVGAACGIHTLDPTSGLAKRTYVVPSEGESQLAGMHGGFNAAALAGEYLFATHSEIGLCRWHIDRPEEYMLLVPDLTQGARAVRHAQFAVGAVWLSVDCDAFALPPAIAMSSGEDSEGKEEIAAYSGSRTVITALALTEEHVFAGNAGGEVLRWETDQRTDPTVIYRGNQRPVEGITLLPAFGVDRLFFTDTSTSLHAQVIGDAFTCRYQAGGQTIRRAEVAPDLVVATNETRDRLFCWPTASPSSAPSVVMVSQITGRSIQDFCLLLDTA